MPVLEGIVEGGTALPIGGERQADGTAALKTSSGGGGSSGDNDEVARLLRKLVFAAEQLLGYELPDL